MRRTGVVELTSDLCGVVTDQRLDLEILLKAEHAAFAAVSRLLVAAEWRLDVLRLSERGVVEINAARAQSRPDATRPREIGRPDIAGETVERAVCDRHGIVLVLV